jgi:acetyl-CoA acetyltransferase family protein
MAFEKSFVPYGAYWSTPFCRWQGSIAHAHSTKLVAQTARAFLDDKEISPEVFGALVLGITVAQRQSFYGAPWLSGMIGAPTITGPTVSQACATSARVLVTAAHEVESGQHDCVLTVACDRTSNGPHVYYPNPSGIGGTGESEDTVWDSFNEDPFTQQAMLQTAENVVRQEGITREEQDELVLIRHEQYQDALAGDRAFQRRYMIPIELTRGKKVTGTVEEDEGVHPVTAEGLAKLRTILKDGTVTSGSQTHPADGNAGLIVCGREWAERMSRDTDVAIQLISSGSARVDPAMMPKAVVPAARDALARANIRIGDCAAIKTHNPFAVNDVFLCREFDLSPERVNRFGSPLIWGHPQAPTGLRAMIEMIEELVAGGGGYGLFTGCAAGDTAMAVVLKVG